MTCPVQVLLPADRIDTESQAEVKVGKVWGLFSDCITVKATALKVGTMHVRCVHNVFRVS